MCPDIADEFVIFHDGKMPRRDMQLMSRILPTRFIEYRLPEAVAAVVEQGRYATSPPWFFVNLSASGY